MQLWSLLEAELGDSSGVLAAEHDGNAREPSRDARDQFPHQRPLVREEAGDAHEPGVGTNAIDDFRDRQPVDHDVIAVPGVHGPDILAHRIDHLHVMAGSRQATGEVGNGQRRRAIEREGVSPDHARHADEGRDGHRRWER